MRKQTKDNFRDVVWIMSTLLPKRRWLAGYRQRRLLFVRPGVTGHHTENCNRVRTMCINGITPKLLVSSKHSERVFSNSPKFWSFSYLLQRTNLWTSFLTSFAFSCSAPLIIYISAISVDLWSCSLQLHLLQRSWCPCCMILCWTTLWAQCSPVLGFIGEESSCSLRLLCHPGWSLEVKAIASSLHFRSGLKH